MTVVFALVASYLLGAACAGFALALAHSAKCDPPAAGPWCVAEGTCQATRHELDVAAAQIGELLEQNLQLAQDRDDALKAARLAGLRADMAEAGARGHRAAAIGYRRRWERALVEQRAVQVAHDQLAVRLAVYDAALTDPERPIGERVRDTARVHQELVLSDLLPLPAYSQGTAS